MFAITIGPGATTRYEPGDIRMDSLMGIGTDGGTSSNMTFPVLAMGILTATSVLCVVMRKGSATTTKKSRTSHWSVLTGP